MEERGEFRVGWRRASRCENVDNASCRAETDQIMDAVIDPIVGLIYHIIRFMSITALARRANVSDIFVSPVSKLLILH